MGKTLRRAATGLLAGLVIAGSGVAMPGMAQAAESSPPGFGPCHPGNLPTNNTLGSMRAHEYYEPGAGILPAFKDGRSWTTERFVDKIVYHSASNHYVHVRYDAQVDQFSRQGCKEKDEDETPQDSPRFSGGSAGYSVVNARFGLGGAFLSFGGDIVRYGEVGEPKPVPPPPSEDEMR